MGGVGGALILAAEQVNICPPSDKRLAVGAVVGVEEREVGGGGRGGGGGQATADAPTR